MLSDECVSLTCTNVARVSVQVVLPLSSRSIDLASRRLVSVVASDAMESLRQLTRVSLFDNALEAIPSGCFSLPSVTQLFVQRNAIAALPPTIARLTSLVSLNASSCRLTSLPVEIAGCRALRELDVSQNRLRSLPGELATLAHLRHLSLNSNSLEWLPTEFRCMQSTWIYVARNPLPIAFAATENAQLRLHEMVIDRVEAMRTRTLALCIGLQALALPALVTLEILDALVPNCVPMHKKWNQITAVKHFRC